MKPWVLGRLGRGGWSALVVVISFFLSSRAEASKTYPAELENRVPMPCPPPCVLCHSTPDGGLGTANKPFALAMKSKGLLPASPATIQPSLDALRTAKTDSDGDGVLDLDELGAGTDPNVSGSGPLCNSPHYGCGAQIAASKPRASAEGWLVLLAAASSAVVLGRKRLRAQR